ncbi:MAG: ABC transporter ATP-binding protein [Burkholderiaceae bacterium]
MLEVHRLTKRHGGAPAPVFSEISFAVAPGEIVALMGESGVGKSTLLNCIAGLEPPTSGRVLIEGADIAALPEAQRAGLRARRLGFVFQAFHVLPTLTVAQNIAVPLLLNQHDGKALAPAVAAALDGVGLTGLQERWPASLSGGELQRVAIARALIHKPALLLADEPTGNLDPKTADKIIALLIAQVHERQAAALIVTHSEHVAQACGRVLLLSPDGLTQR